MDAYIDALVEHLLNHKGSAVSLVLTLVTVFFYHWIRNHQKSAGTQQVTEVDYTIGLVLGIATVIPVWALTRALVAEWIAWLLGFMAWVLLVVVLELHLYIKHRSG